MVVGALDAVGVDSAKAKAKAKAMTSCCRVVVQAATMPRHQTSTMMMMVKVTRSFMTWVYQALRRLHRQCLQTGVAAA